MKNRVLYFLSFATGFFNAATVLPLLFVLPAMVIASKSKRAQKGDAAYILGLACGLPFAVAFTYYFFAKRR